MQQNKALQLPGMMETMIVDLKSIYSTGPLLNVVFCMDVRPAAHVHTTITAKLYPGDIIFSTDVVTELSWESQNGSTPLHIFAMFFVSIHFSSVMYASCKWV